MNSFTFYNNYYEIVKYLSDKDRLKIYDSIFKYMFDDKEPELNGLLNGIWVNLKFPLDTSKKNSGRGGAPKGNQNAKKKTTDKQPINNPKSTQKQTNNISTFLFLISNNNYKYIINNSNIYNSIKEWLEYKQERKEKYTEIGLSKLLNKIDNQIDQYGEKPIINLIEECISNNYQGLIWDKLKNIKFKQNVPDWLDKPIEAEEELTEEERRLRDELIRGY